VGFFYAYNLFEACPEQVPPARGLAGAVSADSVPLSLPTNAPLTARRRAEARLGQDAGDQFGDGDTGLGPACLGAAHNEYLGLEVTKRALGIPLSNRFIVLDNGIGLNYTTDAPFVGHVYRRAIQQGKRVLIYETDMDASGLSTAPIEDIWVPFFANDTDGVWTPAGRLGRPDPASAPLGLEMTASWRPWGVLPVGRAVQGGFVIEWERGQVSFASIRGTGHLASYYRPAAAFTLMSAFQAETSLPPPIIGNIRAR
jgi:hypothetical protein